MRGKNIVWMSLIALLLAPMFIMNAGIASPTTKMYVDPSAIKNYTTLLPVTFKTIRPNGDGTFNAWTGTYGSWDETSQNGDTDYVKAASGGLSESSLLENSGNPTWQPGNVRVVIYAKAYLPIHWPPIDEFDEELYLTVVVGGTEFRSPSYQPTTGYLMYTWDLAVNPQTSAPWTWADIDALEAGVRSLQIGPAWGQFGGLGELRVTQLYVEVNAPTIAVRVQDVPNLYGWSFKLYFNPSIVQVTGVNIPPDSLLRSVGSTKVLSTKYDNVAGYAEVSEMLWLPDGGYPPEGASGSGILAYVNFKVVGIGVTLLDLTITKLNTVVAGNNVPIEHFAEDGLFDNREANISPIAQFTVTPPIGIEGDTFTFDASASSDDGWIVSYHWDFGDGTTADTKVVQRMYGSGTEGTYIVTLTVTDNDGATASAEYTIEVLGWIHVGDHPDLIRTLIWPEHPVFKEAEDGEYEILWAKVGNPTDQSWQVRVDFRIFSKDEGKELGTISTPVETIDPHEIKDMNATFFLGDHRWAVKTGPYNWPYWVKKYWAIGQCYYINETGQWEAGIFPGANQFKIHPVTHDRAIIAMSANYNTTNPAPIGSTVVVQVTVENQGQQIEHDINLTVFGTYGIGPLGTGFTTLGIGEARQYLYRDVDESGTVTVGDIRLTAVESYYAASTVVEDDTDEGQNLVSFQANEKHRENIAANSTYDPGEYIYRDVDGSGNVTIGDIRLTKVGSYPIYSTVTQTLYHGELTDDTDVGYELVAFQASEKHREGKTFTFTWDTTGFAPGNYVIVAVAEMHPYERLQDSVDNTMYIVVRIQ